MGKSSAEIKREIEATRAEMEETVDALSQKFDVKGRARRRARGIVSKPREAMHTFRARVTDVTPDTTIVKDKAGEIADQATEAGHVVQETTVRVAQRAKQNPAAMVVGGLAVGMLAGVLLPRTRMEKERIGPVAEDLREKVIETGEQAVEHGKQVAQEAVTAAAVTVRTEGVTHAQELKQEASETLGIGGGSEGKGESDDGDAGGGGTAGDAIPGQVGADVPMPVGGADAIEGGPGAGTSSLGSGVKTSLENANSGE